MSPRQLAALFLLPAFLPIACMVAAPPTSPEEHDPMVDAGMDESGGNAASQYASSGGNLRASWDRAMVDGYAEMDRSNMAFLQNRLGESVSYRDYSELVRGACDLLDDDVDLSKPDLGMDQIQARQHTPEGVIAVRVYVETGGSWNGYCDWHRAEPEPTPWPTPTVMPDAPLTICQGWPGQGFDDSFCGTGATGVGQQLRVKILPEGHSGWLEVTSHQDGPEAVLCGDSPGDGVHFQASDAPIYEPISTCAEGRVEFRWVPDEGDETYSYELRVVQ